MHAGKSVTRIVAFVHGMSAGNWLVVNSIQAGFFSCLAVVQAVSCKECNFMLPHASVVSPLLDATEVQLPHTKETLQSWWSHWHFVNKSLAWEEKITGWARVTSMKHVAVSGWKVHDVECKRDICPREACQFDNSVSIKAKTEKEKSW